ncbi:MAG: DNA gyrase inhibitor YacG [Acidobacteria bacterium]|nr:DNA gyrase inhibitor YacG [Acidobacteriota bacterium]
MLCPHCKKETLYKGNPWRPFCSDRCKQIDLGKWATENYVISSPFYEDEVGLGNPQASSKERLV